MPAIEQRLHWSDEIDGFRDRIERKLSPTIRRQLNREFEAAFFRARRRVLRKMERCEQQSAAALAREMSLHPWSRSPTTGLPRGDRT